MSFVDKNISPLAGSFKSDKDGPCMTRSEWQKLLIDHGYFARSIPKKYGGYGGDSDILKQRIIASEFSQAELPPPMAGQGIDMLVPTLLELGTEEQKEKYIKPTLHGEMIWCQGYSEPNAGSDLASLQTKGELIDGQWVINGQKIWTSTAQYSQMMFCLVRTEPNEKKHAGISYLLIPMDTPGIEVKPLVDMTLKAGFNEVFFTDVKIPEKNISTNEVKSLKNLEKDLKTVIFGQDQAITSLANAIKLSRAGLRDDNKTIGSFLFAGPTGVGKTEISKQLANILGIELIRFDMSEYMERHTVSRLIGAPPGYVGFDQGGLLTESISKHPHCVLLLDEIEKANPDIFNILLQVMDNGVLTDNNGRKADFRNVILIMTTNAGAELLEKKSVGFNEVSNETDAMSAIKRLFSPEFRNRLDETIQFNYLPKKVILSIVDKFLVKLQAQLDERSVELIFDKKVCQWIADNGYNKEMGARPMERFIADNIKKPLVNSVLYGELSSGGQLQVGLKDNQVFFKQIKKTEKVK